MEESLDKCVSAITRRDLRELYPLGKKTILYDLDQVIILKCLKKLCFFTYLDVRFRIQIWVVALIFKNAQPDVKSAYGYVADS